MNFQRINESFFEFSEKILAYIINLFYYFILALPLVLVGLFIKDGIFGYPLFFIPLVTLYILGLKSLVYVAYMILIKKKKYYKPYFWISLKENFVQVYLYYLVFVTLLYFGLTSTIVLINTVSELFWILFNLIIIIILPIIIFSTLQFSLYEKKSIKQIFNNSIILSLMFGVISVAMTIILGIIIYLFPKNIFLIICLMPAYSTLYVLLYYILDKKNLTKNRG